MTTHLYFIDKNDADVSASFANTLTATGGIFYMRITPSPGATNDDTRNAVVAMLPRLQCIEITAETTFIFVSTELSSLLTSEELAAAINHERGHIALEHGKGQVGILNDQELEYQADQYAVAICGIASMVGALQKVATFTKDKAFTMLTDHGISADEATRMISETYATIIKGRIDRLLGV